MSKTSLRLSVLCILFGSFLHSTYAATNKAPTDSSSIASFFSPQNLPNINTDSKDSLYALLKGDAELIDIYQFQKAQLYLITGKLNEAKTTAQNYLPKIPKKLKPYAKAKFYNIIGKVHANQQESQKAISYFQKALKLSEESGKETNAALMNSNIANIYFSLVDYESAYKYAWNGYQVMKNYPDHPFYSNLLAVLSISEAKVGKMKAAKEHGQIALKSAKSKDLIAQIVANLALGEVANSDKEFAQAKEHFLRSLEISDKYRQTPFIILNSIGLMTANLGTKDFLSAVTHGERAISLVDTTGDMTTIYSIKKNLAKAYFGIQEYAKAYQLMESSHNIFLDKNSIENKKAINELLVKYDTEKKEKALAKSKSKLLQEKIDRRNLSLLLVILFVLIVVLGMVLLFIRQRNKNRLALFKSKKEKETMQAIFDAEEIERERIARELHDGVASSLVAARYQVSSNATINAADKELLENLLLQTHEETRRLSHNLAPVYIEKYGFHDALMHFANDNKTADCTIHIALLPRDAQLEKNKANVIYRVAQELTQNALKHAKASEISIQVMVEDKNVTLMVEDNGAGFDVSSTKQSTGLTSIERRAEQMDGYFEVESRINSGTIATFGI
jgi:signal transduction histidine kinase